ncbi:hypothetical protein PRZ48_001105 [Zasmidium cellare]|uniref:Heterokaryon incompatibility domain-containing protein n=1 Tax=Zasmidium cellare TaxID=395010 RepID=A0ABR0F1S4_ZASCE|nr:hypothetical protein PRZ48_001105 [Zasmidium cellare]
MWLLNARTLQLETFLGSHTPRYAILSHTWSDEEVSFQDMVHTSAQQKQGFAKIKGACSQALHDGFGYIWIDTCCIDKTSSAELSEAINSMFRYYAESSICYAYLSDVVDLYDGEGDSSHMDMFLRSRYWTRGWTLQELIAPSEVEFFDRSWKYINSRTAAAPQIAQITGIDVGLLSSNKRGDVTEALASYSVAQRLSWAATRLTTRLEDAAYSLFGLFGVNLPLLYGEGSAAFDRLQQEILRATGDLSILAWPRDPENGLTPLARLPRNFSSTRVVVRADGLPFAARAEDSDAAMSTGGLRVRAPIAVIPSKPGGEPGLAMILECRYQTDITTVLALKLTASSSSTQKDFQGLMQQERLDCSVGWSSEAGQERLVQVDVLDVAEISTIKTIFIRRSRVENGHHPSTTLSRPRGWTTLWLRLENLQAWEILNLYPRPFWNRANYTFDLVKAREGRIRTDKSAVAGTPLSTFGLSVSGAIAITDRNNDRIAIFFTQHSPSLEDGIEYSVELYKDEESFLNHEFRRKSSSRQKVCSIDLPSSKSTLSFEFRAVQISEQNVAVLAAAFSSPEKKEKKASHGLHGMSRVRGPLHLLKKHREE